MGAASEKEKSITERPSSDPTTESKGFVILNGTLAFEWNAKTWFRSAPSSSLALPASSSACGSNATTSVASVPSTVEQDTEDDDYASDALFSYFHTTKGSQSGVFLASMC